MRVKLIMTANGGACETVCDSDDQALIDLFGPDTIDEVCKGATVSSRVPIDPNQVDFGQQLFDMAARTNRELGEQFRREAQKLEEANLEASGLRRDHDERMEGHN